MIHEITPSFIYTFTAFTVPCGAVKTAGRYQAWVYRHQDQDQDQDRPRQDQDGKNVSLKV